MASGKRKKNNKRNKKKGSTSGISWKDSIQNWFKDRNPVMKFLLGFVGCMVIFYLFYHSSLYKNHLEAPLLGFQANLSNVFLNLFGYETTVSDTTIAGEGFSVNIKSGCDGLEAMAILLSGILIFPTPFRLKLPGLLWGILTLFILNLLRIAGLYLTGLHFSQTVFDIFHIQGGFIIFTMISVLLWFIWMNWSFKRLQANPSS